MIVVAVRWYLRFGLSYREVEELLAERHRVDHVTIYRWVLRFTPLLAEAARIVGSYVDPAGEVVPRFVDLEVAVPHLSPAVW